jgi:hypothetical protein
MLLTIVVRDELTTVPVVGAYGQAYTLAFEDTNSVKPSVDKAMPWFRSVCAMTDFLDPTSETQPV